jgi:secretion/DNA translocation related TadE-like protein
MIGWRGGSTAACRGRAAMSGLCGRLSAGGGDRGSATVLVLAFGLVVVLIGAAFAQVGAAVVARHRAQVAADLGALAGAAWAPAGRSAACSRAAELVSANGAALEACALNGLDVTITATVAFAGTDLIAQRARSSARAGPAAER